MSLVVPAEWAPHRAMWLGFPSHEDLWEDDLPAAEAEVAALARALGGPGGERVRLLTGCPEGEAAARRLRPGGALALCAWLRGGWRTSRWCARAPRRRAPPAPRRCRRPARMMSLSEGCGSIRMKPRPMIYGWSATRFE